MDRSVGEYSTLVVACESVSSGRFLGLAGGLRLGLQGRMWSWGGAEHVLDSTRLALRNLVGGQRVVVLRLHGTESIRRKGADYATDTPSLLSLELRQTKEKIMAGLPPFRADQIDVHLTEDRSMAVLTVVNLEDGMTVMLPIAALISLQARISSALGSLYQPSQHH